MKTTVVITALSMVLGLQTPAATVGDRVECTPCRIRIGPSTRVMDETGTINSAAIAANGHIWLSYHEAPYELYEHSAGGKLLRKVGRKGSGPADFKRVTYIAALWDSLVVFDSGNGRVAVVDPASGAVGRTFPHGTFQVFSAIASADNLIASGVKPRDSNPIHPYTRSGAELASFGGPVAHWQFAWPMMRFLGVSKNGNTVSMTPLRYEATVFDKSGARIRSVIRQGSWAPSSEEPKPLLESGPAPTILSMASDNAGLLWVTIRVADPKWKKGVGALKQTPEGSYYPVEDPERVYDTILEVLDIDRAKVLTRVRSGGLLYMVQPGWLLRMSSREDEPVLDFRRVWLTGDPGQRSDGR